MKRLDGMRILAIDDSSDTREVLAMLLELHGAQVAAAGNAKEAVDMAVGGSFHIVLSDIKLPDATGYDLLRLLRSRHGINAPAIAMTGFSDYETRSLIEAAGFARQMTKPLDLDVLVDVIAELVEPTTT